VVMVLRRHAEADRHLVEEERLGARPVPPPQVVAGEEHQLIGAGAERRPRAGSGVSVRPSALVTISAILRWEFPLTR
jgi:hypothetical protein